MVLRKIYLLITWRASWLNKVFFLLLSETWLHFKAWHRHRKVCFQVRSLTEQVLGIPIFPILGQQHIFSRPGQFGVVWLRVWFILGLPDLISGATDVGYYNYRLWESPMFVSSPHTQVSFVKRTRTHCLRAWVCVDVYFKQCISQIIDFIEFSNFLAKTFVTKLVSTRQLSTKQRKHECLCSNDEEHMSNGYRRSDICCSSSLDCTNIKIWISKVTNSFFDNEFSTACIFQSPSEISRKCASDPWKDYKSSNRVDQVPGKLIDFIWIEQHIYTQHFKSG